MLYPIYILLLLIAFLIRKKIINLNSSKDNKNGHIIISKMIFFLVLTLISIETLSYIKIENENLNLAIRIVLLCLLCFISLYYINKMQGKKFRINLFNSITTIGMIILAVILFLSLKQPSLIIEHDKFKINSFISPREYYLSNIDSVAFVENPIKVRQKLSGFDFSGIYRGSFTLNDSEQPYFLYLNENYSNKIFIYLKNKDIVIFNTSNTENLNDLYKILDEELKSR